MRLVVSISELFLLITPLGMTIFLAYKYGSSWNKVGWNEYVDTFRHLIIPILANGFVAWRTGEKFRTTPSN